MSHVGRRALLTGCAAMAASSGVAVAGPSPVTWIAFYGQTADEKVLATYDYVVLDPSFRGSLAAITSGGKARVCAYLSLGESRPTNFFDEQIHPALFVSGWPDRIDVRRDPWRALIIDRIIPALIAKGYTGLMFDTLDTPPYLETVDPRRCKGMRQAAIDLVVAIRQAYPNLLLIMNRGYALLPDLYGQIDMIVAESFLTRPDTAAGFARNESKLIAEQLVILLRVKAHNCPILSLDYCDPLRPGDVASLYAQERQLGHIPYVATGALDRIIPEPRNG